MNSALTLVTPEKAQALLATAYQGQRPLRPHHVRFLRHLLRTGHWRQGAEIHCARIGTERFLINGQHTLTALVQEHLSAWLTVVEIDVPTLAAIGRLYESFDRNLTRSLDDIYQSDPAMRQYAWTGKQLKAMGGAVAVVATGYAKDALFADILLTLRDPFVRRADPGLERGGHAGLWGDAGPTAPPAPAQRGAQCPAGDVPLCRAAGGAVLAGGLSRFGAHRGHAGTGARALSVDHVQPSHGGTGVCAPRRQRLERLLRTARAPHGGAARRGESDPDRRDAA